MRDLFFLCAGRFEAPRSLVSPETAWWDLGSCPLTATVAVCVRDGGDVVLVDAGFSEAACRDLPAEIGRLRALTLRAAAEPGDAVRTQLGALGVDPDRVTAVVATHLHLDHIGGVTDFPNAELLTTRSELRSFLALPRHVGYRGEDLVASRRIRVVDLDRGPHLGFPSSHDVFGDGEVVLCDARGHTRGHVAAALRGPDRLYVHVGDAAYLSWEYGTSPAGPSRLAAMVAADRAWLARTIEAIRQCEALPERPVIVPSHDRAVFEALPHGPAARAAAAGSA